MSTPTKRQKPARRAVARKPIGRVVNVVVDHLPIREVRRIVESFDDPLVTSHRLAFWGILNTFHTYPPEVFAAFVRAADDLACTIKREYVAQQAKAVRR